MLCQICLAGDCFSKKELKAALDEAVHRVAFVFTTKKTSRKPKAKKSSSSWIPGHPHPEPNVKRIRTAKGRRPYFFEDPNIDKLLAMIMALTGEVSVLRERLDTHERLAAKKKWPSHQAIEDYEPDEITEAFRAQWRS